MMGFLLMIAPFRSLSGFYFPFNGFSPLIMIFIYVTTRIVRLTGVGQKIATGRYLLLAGGFLCGSVVMAVFILEALGVRNVFSAVRPWFSFYMPPIYCFAIVLVTFFTMKVHVPDRVGRVASFLAPSMFGVFLAHETTSFGFDLYRPLQRFLENETALHPACIILTSAVVTFFICVLIDLVRRSVVRIVVVPVLSKLQSSYEGSKKHRVLCESRS